MAAILFSGGHFLFLATKVSRAIMNYHEKSGASSLKTDWIMLNLGFGGHFVFWWPFWILANTNCGRLLWTTMKNLGLLAWKLTELCLIQFWRPFCFLVAILFFGKKMWSAIMNCHAKSGASSLKIDRVMALPRFCPKLRLKLFIIIIYLLLTFAFHVFVFRS